MALDLLEFRQTLGVAYGQAHAGDRHGAVLMLREKFSPVTVREAAKAHAAKIAAVVEARSSGGQCGCYVTKFAHDLLTEALADA